MGLVNIYYKTMFDMHPWPTGFLKLIDGPILKFHKDPKFSNTCATEISYAFNCIPGHPSCRCERRLRERWRLGQEGQDAPR
jgi:hypothetical protein